MIRIKDIAEQAGVSPTTVSNVIHGNTKKVSPQMVEKIQEILKENRYIPSMGARMLAGNRSRIIGVLMGSSEERNKELSVDPFTGKILSTIEQEIYKQGYFMLFHMSVVSDDNWYLASAWNMEGLITIGLTEKENVRIRDMVKVPMVSVDNYYGTDALPNVGLDDYGGGKVMAEYLLSLGHRNLVFMADNDIGVDHERYMGVCMALKEAGILLGESRRILIPMEKEERMKWYEELLPIFLERKSLFFASDYYASEAVRFLQDKGIEVPRQVSVVGFDDNEFAQVTRPKLTTIHQDVDEKGRQAIHKLFDLIHGESRVRDDVKLPVRLVIRDSAIEMPER